MFIVIGQFRKGLDVDALLMVTWRNISSSVNSERRSRISVGHTA